MQDIIDAVQGYPMDAVTARYAKDTGLSENAATEHERELKRFLALICMNPQTNYGMKGPVDELWHTFIIHTRNYREFCETIAGRFIDHVPEVPTALANRNSGSSYSKFLSDYKATFGEDAPIHIWPRVQAGSEHASCSECSGCGAPAPTCGSNTIGECSGCNGCSTPS